MARGFSRQADKIALAAAAALYELGQDILKRSDELIPVDTGTAKASGRVMFSTGAGGPRVVVGYGYGEQSNPKTGEPAIGYVIPLHERVEVQHETGQAKFLETAALEHLPKAAVRVAAKIQRARVTFSPATGAREGLEYFLEDLSEEN